MRNFEKNDKNFVTAYKITNFIIVIFCMLSIIGGFVCIGVGASTRDGGYLIGVGVVLLLIVAPLITWLCFVFAKLIFGTLYDIKAIRNAIYKQSNYDIDVIFNNLFPSEASNIPSNNTSSSDTPSNDNSSNSD